MIRLCLLSLCLFPLLTNTGIAQTACFTPENLISLDANWEKAQLELDIAFIRSLLADEYIWVHNHANTIDDKDDVLNRLQRYITSNKAYSKSRKSFDVKATIKGSTGIVTGRTTVDNGTTVTTYFFMRTYIAADGKCQLLANQTMAIPDIDNP